MVADQQAAKIDEVSALAKEKFDGKDLDTVLGRLMVVRGMVKNPSVISVLLSSVGTDNGDTPEIAQFMKERFALGETFLGKSPSIFEGFDVVESEDPDDSSKRFINLRRVEIS